MEALYFLFLSAFFFFKVERYSASQCQGLQVVHPMLFFPFCWNEAPQYYSPPRSIKEWEDLVKDSYSMDFFASSSNNTMPIMKPQYYGAEMPAYAALGPKYCPRAFFSAKHF